MYLSPNLPSKAAFKRAIKAGDTVTAFAPGLGGPPPANGTVTFEGPHYPKPHSFYGQATLKDGKVVTVK
jgi:hypothetical protein